MKNGQLKPAYNLQISTNNQYIASYSIHLNTTDTSTLIPHIEQHIKNFKEKPGNITADAGYGSEQNFQWLKDNKITGYVKHNYFDRDQNSNLRNKKPYSVDKLHYDQPADRYLCPIGQPMEKIGSYHSKNKTGYQ